MGCYCLCGGLCRWIGWFLFYVAPQLCRETAKAGYVCFSRYSWRSRRHRCLVDTWALALKLATKSPELFLLSVPLSRAERFGPVWLSFGVRRHHRGVNYEEH